MSTICRLEGNHGNLTQSHLPPLASAVTWQDREQMHWKRDFCLTRRGFEDHIMAKCPLFSADIHICRSICTCYLLSLASNLLKGFKWSPCTTDCLCCIWWNLDKDAQSIRYNIDISYILRIPGSWWYWCCRYCDLLFDACYATEPTCSSDSSELTIGIILVYGWYMQSLLELYTINIYWYYDKCYWDWVYLGYIQL